uniref:Uncharacterized protein n=1 Tax=Caenorhabditis japonica TaxID=281687 RepID=A0A8R1IMP7_CAEJA
MATAVWIGSKSVSFLSLCPFPDENLWGLFVCFLQLRRGRKRVRVREFIMRVQSDTNPLLSTSCVFMTARVDLTSSAKKEEANGKVASLPVLGKLEGGAKFERELV